MVIIGVPADSVVTRKRGELVTFSVEVNRNTPAMVKWFLNGASFSSSTDKRIQIGNEYNEEFDVKKVWTQSLDASLHITDVRCDDTGYYQVEISNPAESILFTYRLVVEDCTMTCKYCDCS